jgi:hypothetical protein
MRWVFAAAMLGLAAGECGGTKNPGNAEVSVDPPDYTKDSHAPAEVRQKCRFEHELAAEIAKASPKAAVGGTGGKRLTMKIIHMRGADPSSEGDISVIVEGELIDGGATIGSFKLRREARPGVMGGMGGICRGLDEIAAIMAADIAYFIDEPEMNADLG